MNIRRLCIAGAASMLFGAPAAFASDNSGWYFDLGAGWDRMNNLEVSSLGNSPVPVSDSDGALVVGGVGYRFPARFRVEFEAGWDDHSITQTGDGGDVQIRSAMLNFAYDFPIAPRWDFSVGAGIGAADGDVNITQGPFTLAQGNHVGYMWQGMAGLDYSLTRNVDLVLDWRYRDLAENKAYSTSFVLFQPIRVKNLHENAVVLSARWYPWAAAPPPAAPPPPAPPPPPPPPPPPTKTFIVFFDFNKSNLTAEAQAVVAEAVKTAKANGMVRVMVTGHTDTVGSDSYNQGLSVRRAESVKNEMVREGMDGSTISIEGKSFHDPLVPTGPGVREPQNRRAVIDLGG